VLDSPLVTYQEADEVSQEEVTDLIDAFYRTLARSPKEEQILIFENEDPPGDVSASVNHVHFSRADGAGRYGFIPRSRP
jgi:hypothetical protein